MIRSFLLPAGARARRSLTEVRLSLGTEDFPWELRVMRDLVGTYTEGSTEAFLARRKYGCLLSDETVAAQCRALDRANRSLRRDLDRLRESGLRVIGAASFDEAALFQARTW